MQVHVWLITQLQVLFLQFIYITCSLISSDTILLHSIRLSFYSLLQSCALAFCFSLFRSYYFILFDNHTWVVSSSTNIDIVLSASFQCSLPLQTMHEVYQLREMWCEVIRLNCDIAVRAEHSSILETVLRLLCDHLTCSKKVVHVFYNRENIK